MKTKKNFLMPAVVFAIAIGSAVMSQAAEKSVVAEVDGYILNNGICNQVTRCSTIPGETCKWQGQDVFG